MSDWTDGYVTELEYIYGYFSELNPVNIDPLFAHARLRAPKVRTACELGFGQGLGPNLLGAASEVEWWGTDFNPTQAGFARDLAAAGTSNAQLFDQSFEEFCSREDLPGFDLIVLHGIWSWVDARNKGIIVDFIRRKLNIGGVVYMGYNTLPGWNSIAPLQYIMSQHSDRMSAPGQDLSKSLTDARDFTSRLMASDPRFARGQKAVHKHMETIASKDPNYLAHEYFNRNWTPMYFSDVVEMLSDAKLSYGTTANYETATHPSRVTKEQRAVLNEIDDPIFRETLIDFMVNETFRKDYFVRGPRKLNLIETMEQVQRNHVILRIAAEDVTYTYHGNELTHKIFKPIVEHLADGQVHNVGAVVRAMQRKGLNAGNVINALVILMSMDQVMPCQAPEVSERVRERTARMNGHIVKTSMAHGKVTRLASPVLGGGIGVNRIEQLLLLGRSQGKTEVKDCAMFAWNALEAQGQRLSNKGKKVQDPSESQKQMLDRARKFEADRLPYLRRLQVV